MHPPCRIGVPSLPRRLGCRANGTAVWQLVRGVRRTPSSSDTWSDRKCKLTRETVVEHGTVLKEIATD